MRPIYDNGTDGGSACPWPKSHTHARRGRKIFGVFPQMVRSKIVFIEPPLGMTIKCKPLLTDEDVLYDSEFDLDVK